MVLSSDPRLRHVILPLLKTVKKRTFLDVACGFGKWGKQIRSCSQPIYLLGLDVWKPYLLNIKRNYVYDELILADVRKLPFRAKSIDVSLACEVIEHLSKSEGDAFLTCLEQISRQKIIISTPNLTYQQDEVRGNPYEKHLSVWKDVDFKRRGYKVQGVGVQFGDGKVFGDSIPFFGKFLTNIVLLNFTRFAELIVATKGVL